MNPKYLISIPFFTFCLLSAQPLLAQDNYWKTLSKVTFNKIMDKELGYQISYPIFTDDIKELDGKEIIIKGYIIPLEDELGYFAFSAFPFQNCFFCGNAGVETVMEVYADKPIDYTAKSVKLKGTLELNQEDILDHLLSILRDAVVYEE